MAANGAAGGDSRPIFFFDIDNCVRTLRKLKSNSIPEINQLTLCLLNIALLEKYVYDRDVACNQPRLTPSRRVQYPR